MRLAIKLFIFLFHFYNVTVSSANEADVVEDNPSVYVAEVNDISCDYIAEPILAGVDYTAAKTIQTQELYLSEEEIELIALVTMAEAEGECEEGKRLVIDTVLNRMESEHFPNSVYEVVYQPRQFDSMWNGRSDRCYVDGDIYKLVCEELQSRTNHDVIFFTASKYSIYGTPLLQVGNHYFSSYD